VRENKTLTKFQKKKSYLKFLIFNSNNAKNIVQTAQKLQESVVMTQIAQIIVINFILNVKDWQI
jgi:hypothetical protein